MLIDAPPITAIVPYFGGNRLLAAQVGQQIGDCEWVGIPFFGSGPELLHIRARTIVANDLHRHVINLACVLRTPELRRTFLASVKHQLFHGWTLKTAQDWCKANEPACVPDVTAAVFYFVSQWMGRSGKSGTDGEFNGGLPVRWSASGGDSAVRYRSSVRSVARWGKALERVNFLDSMDGLKFLSLCKDARGHAIYCDPPFPDAGADYRHKVDEAWHCKLAEKLASFRHTRVVCRFYDHPLIRELYPTSEWAWLKFSGRKQSNAESPERLIINGPPNFKGDGLFIGGE